MYQRIASKLYCVGMRSDITKFVEECDTCQRNKSLTTTSAGLLQPIPLPLQTWETITTDFIEGLPKVNGNSTILVVVDRLSRYAHFINLKHPFSTQTVAAIFMKEVVWLHGIPTSIILDRDGIFLSNFWKEIFRLQGTMLKRSTTYHPQTYGQSEVVNRCLETYLYCFLSEKPRQWPRWVS